MTVSDQFIEENPGCWIFNNQKPVQPVSGLAFGSRVIGGAGVRLWEILPGSWFQRVQNPHNFWRAWLIDACLGHADNRQVVFQEWKVGSLKPCFIDHGFLFGGADGTHRPKAARSRYLDPRVYGNAPVPQLSKYAKTIHEVFPEILRSLVQDVPAQWKTTSAIASFERYVERLSEPGLCEGVLDEILQAYSHVSNPEAIESRSIFAPAFAGLQVRMPATQL
ncbi:MAG: hypothetical protein WBQ95_10785 [Terracidiphilus sp.]